MNSMQKTLTHEGFTVVVQASEIKDHEAVVVAVAKRGGRTIGRSRAIRTDLSSIGLLSIKNDSNVNHIIEFAVPLAVSDARVNLRRMVVEGTPLDQLIAA